MDRRPGGMPHPEGKNKARMDHARAERPTRREKTRLRMDRARAERPTRREKTRLRMDRARAERPTRKIVPSLPSGEQPTPHHPLIAEQANVEQTKNQIYSKSPANMLQYNRL